MSWSITFIGKPENVAKALEEESVKLNGLSKDEYDAAVPHFIAIVKQNYGGDKPPMIKISASGSGYTSNGKEQRQCTVSVEAWYGIIV
jgi:hypothetical protein